MQKIEGKVAYITGGTKGIGLGIAKSLVENGVKVAISGRNIDDVEKARQYLGKENVLAIQSDVRFFEDEQNAVEQIISAFGRLDIVIANAGLGKFVGRNKFLCEWSRLQCFKIWSCRIYAGCDVRFKKL